MIREFPYWTVGKIIQTIQKDGLVTFNRMSYRNLERRGVLPELHRTAGNWRVAKNVKEAIDIMRKIWENTYGKEEGTKYHAKLRSRYNNS
jgi:hypothetical protein